MVVGLLLTQAGGCKSFIMQLKSLLRVAILAAGLAGACFSAATVSRADIGVVTPNGSALAAYLDSFQVQHWWLPVAVNWQTGSPNTPIGTGGNNDFVVSTHCSCFTAAVANPLGIYILRSPEHSWSNLANAQDTWYPSAEGIGYGWIGIPKNSTNGVVAQSLANQGYLVIAVYLSPTGSGHTAVIHPYVNTVANITAVGAEECQSGTYNFNLSNVSTGFNQHPGAFPSGIDYFYHAVTYPISPLIPAISGVTVSNGTLRCQVSSLVGRNYRLQTTTDFSTWNTVLTFTNSNVPITLYTTTNLAVPAPQACTFGIQVTDPYGIVSQVVTQSSTVTGITLNGPATMNWSLGATFVDPGAIATENCSTSLAVTTNGTVNVNVLGTYTLTYQATTSGGSNLVATRTVNVNQVNKTTPTVTLVSSANPASEGQPITFSATISGGTTPTGTVTFMNGSAVLGSATLSGTAAAFTTSGGAGTNAITAVYSGDANNNGSTSGALQQVIQSGGVVVAGVAALMQDGQDYAASGSTGAGANVRGPWSVGGGTGSTSFIKILAGDLSGATSPDILPLTNSVNPAAKLQLSKAGSNSRWYYRSLSNNVSSGAVYFSFLLNVVTNPVMTDEFMASLQAAAANLPGGTNSPPAPTDPLTLHARKGADTSHFDLGVERLNGTTTWTGDLTDNTTYLVVLKYSFGSSATCSLYVNPTPGSSEPAVATATATTGGTPEPANIGTVLFYEAGSAVTYLTSGGFQYDVMRADNDWSDVTPSINGSSIVSGATKLVFSPAAQTINVNSNSVLITVTLEDQSNHVFTATSDTVVNLSSTSDNSDLGRGTFLSGADGVTEVTSVTIASGTSTATFFYNDGVVGIPAITAASGLLTSATQTEKIYAPPANGQITSVTGTGPFQASIVFYGIPGTQYHVQRSTDLITWTTPGEVVTADSNGIINYTDAGGLGNAGFYKLVYP